VGIERSLRGLRRENVSAVTGDGSLSFIEYNEGIRGGLMSYKRRM
jgi:hypothetical protein